MENDVRDVNYYDVLSAFKQYYKYNIYIGDNLYKQPPKTERAFAEKVFIFLDSIKSNSDYIHHIADIFLSGYSFYKILIKDHNSREDNNLIQKPLTSIILYYINYKPSDEQLELKKSFFDNECFFQHLSYENEKIIKKALTKSK